MTCDHGTLHVVSDGLPDGTPAVQEIKNKTADIVTMSAVRGCIDF